ncbi:hypothetical protein PQE20_17775 [Vibrio harveyi]|uniref:hypothetical protein n=1 Tax=Vibrio harveyi group TaxID=717610 RepID=UPI0011AB5573|nr:MULTISPECIES: hypothetical protein [Vibrio harveyi group]WCP83268.1 hypothetical protein PQE20_17775 [Vibrio harveyi]
MSRLQRTLQHPLINGFTILPNRFGSIYPLRGALAIYFWVCVFFGGGSGTLSDQSSGFVSTNMAFNLFFLILFFQFVYHYLIRRNH